MGYSAVKTRLNVIIALQLVILIAILLPAYEFVVFLAPLLVILFVAGLWFVST